MTTDARPLDAPPASARRSSRARRQPAGATRCGNVLRQRSRGRRPDRSSGSSSWSPSSPTVLAATTPTRSLLGVEPGGVTARAAPCIHLLGCPADQPEHLFGPRRQRPRRVQPRRLRRAGLAADRLRHGRLRDRHRPLIGAVAGLRRRLDRQRADAADGRAARVPGAAAGDRDRDRPRAEPASTPSSRSASWRSRSTRASCAPRCSRSASRTTSPRRGRSASRERDPDPADHAQLADAAHRQGTLGIGGAVLEVAALSFLGLGAQPPTRRVGLDDRPRAQPALHRAAPDPASRASRSRSPCSASTCSATACATRSTRGSTDDRVDDRRRGSPTAGRPRRRRRSRSSRRQPAERRGSDRCSRSAACARRSTRATASCAPSTASTSTSTAARSWASSASRAAARASRRCRSCGSIAPPGPDRGRRGASSTARTC